MRHLVEKWKAFCEWQRRPSHIPQMGKNMTVPGTCHIQINLHNSKILPKRFGRYGKYVVSLQIIK